LVFAGSGMFAGLFIEFYGFVAGYYAVSSLFGLLEGNV
jgi:hypothetical protein